MTCLPKLLASSRADFKRRVSGLVDLKAELLPYNSELIAFLPQQRQVGRPIVLVTSPIAGLRRPSPAGGCSETPFPLSV
jgi:hypothetical protein